MMKRLRRTLAVAAVSLLVTTASFAQTVLIPGSLKGIGTMGPPGVKRLCSPLSIGLYEWQIGWVTRLLKPTESQTALLNQLAADSARARQAIATACASNGTPTTLGQLDMMERRLEGMTEAVSLIRPGYERFYASLDAQQKSRLEALGPARSGWRW